MSALAVTPTVPDCHRGGCGCYGGGWGCYGGCYGGCWGCYGGCWGCYGGCWGCYGGYASSYAPVYGGGYAAPVVSYAQAQPVNKAKIVVQVPADAKVYIDDHLTKATADKRTFDTPTLDPSQAYYYELRAEVVRDGKTYTERKRVTFRAGQTVNASFTEASLANAGKANPDTAVASR
jgi:uncharacterized protein (TIGR03000 family)